MRTWQMYLCEFGVAVNIGLVLLLWFWFPNPLPEGVVNLQRLLGANIVAFVVAWFANWRRSKW